MNLEEKRLYQRKWYAKIKSDPIAHAKYKAQRNAKRVERLSNMQANDPVAHEAYMAERRKYHREYLKNWNQTEAGKRRNVKRTPEYYKERYHKRKSNPVYYAKVLERAREYQRRRSANEPGYKEAQNERVKAIYRRRQAEKKSDKLAVA